MKIRRLIMAGFAGLFLFIVLIFGAPNILIPVEADALSELPLARNVVEAAPLAIPLVMTAPTSVSLTPEKLGVISSTYVFRATIIPTDTTQPISYTWEATGQSSVGHVSGFTDTVSFSWPVSGTQVVTVTATNSWGVVTDTYTIFVSDLPNLDTMVVFDVSGSMDFETNCFGCWTEDPAKSADIMNNPFPTNGDANPLNYNVPAGTNANVFWGGGSPAGDLTQAGHAVCEGPYAPLAINGHKYVVLEAELYSENKAGANILPWQFEKREAGQGFWVLQRQGVGSNKAHMRTHSFVTYSQYNLADFPQLQGGAYNAECFNPDGSLSGQCWKVTASSLGQTAPSTPPYLDYDFTVTWDSEPDSNTSIWVRAIGGSIRSRKWSGQTETLVPPVADWRKALYFQVNTGGSLGLIGGTELPNIGSQGSNIHALLPSDEANWRWVKINNFNLDLANGQHTLRLYQGSSAFNLDKIIITNDPSGSFGTVRQCFFGSCSGTPPVDPLGYGPEGPPATAGSATREACNMCNPMYGQNITDGPNQCSCKVNPADNVANDSDGISVGSGANCTGVIDPTDMTRDDLFHDMDPIRSAQEAVKNFAARLDPKFDQIGVIAFSDSVAGRVKLQCLRYEPAHGGTPEDCYDPTTDPISYTRVIQAVEDYTPGGNTDISEGMREALKELGLTIGSPTIGHSCTGAFDASNNQACDRYGAAQRVLIVMTDGAPNLQVSGCSTQIPWRGLVGTNDPAYNCSMYFAREAANNKVAVFTVGIGPGVNYHLLTAMAEGKVDLPDPSQPCDPLTNSNGHPCGDNGFYFVPYCGQYFSAANLNDLDAIFEQILAAARSCSFLEPPPPTFNEKISAQNSVLLQSQSLTVDLFDHDHTLSYDVLLEKDGIKYRICANLYTAPATNNLTVNCSLLSAEVWQPSPAPGSYVPISPGLMPLGQYTLYSVLAGSISPTVAAWGSLVEILPAGNPTIAVEGQVPPQSIVWAANEEVDVTLNLHDVAYTYDVELFDPDGNEWLIATNHDPALPISNWKVPNVGSDVCGVIGVNKCWINSFVTGTSTPVATTTLRINYPLIVMDPPNDTDPSDGHIAYVRGEYVYLYVRAHTPFKSYGFQIPTGTPTVLTTVDTDQNGETFVPVVWIIPDDCGGGTGFPNGSYTLSSHSIEGSFPEIATKNFEVFTPPNPALTVDGGTSWPAGSSITIRVHRHLTETTHYLEFDGVRIPTAAVDDTFLTSGCGEAGIPYTIPSSTLSGTHTIVSYNISAIQQATRDLTIQAAVPPSGVYLPIILKE